ncbi:hypothetical protein ACHAWF_009267 [Thalassiosira exigua]
MLQKSDSVRPCQRRGGLMKLFQYASLLDIQGGDRRSCRLLETRCRRWRSYLLLCRTVSHLLYWVELHLDWDEVIDTQKASR